MVENNEKRSKIIKKVLFSMFLPEPYVILSCVRWKKYFLIISKHFSLFLTMWTHAQECVHWSKYTTPSLMPQIFWPFQVIDLNLNENLLTEISADLSKCPRLKILRLQNNRLSLNQIPEKILSDSKVIFWGPYNHGEIAIWCGNWCGSRDQTIRFYIAVFFKAAI